MTTKQLCVFFLVGIALLGLLWFVSPLRNSIPGFGGTTRLPDKNFSSTDAIRIALKGVQAKKTEATLTRVDGSQSSANIQTLQKGDEAVYTIEKPVSFQPGKYTLTIMTENKRKYVQDFTWGVLAVNTNKSIYLPNETAKLSLAVLDEHGDMVCDADVHLQIRNPNSEIRNLTTKTGEIIVNPECKIKNYTERPDYEAEYQVGGVGIYEMEMTATTKNGTYTIHDSFEVKDSVPFDVERISATRIYPIHKYPVRLTITANQDFKGEIIERVPQAFQISSASASEIRRVRSGGESYNTRDIVWNVEMKKGEKKTLSYWYDSPDESPYFFLLGPLKFVSGSSYMVSSKESSPNTKYEIPNTDVAFEELRHWQIAVDAVPTAVEQQINIPDQTYASTTETSAPTDNSLGIANYTSSKYNNQTNYFEAVVKETKGDKLRNTSGDMSQTYCVSTTDCKIAYIDMTNASLRFMDCDDATCSSGTRTTLDGKDCVFPGCSRVHTMTSGVVDETLSMYCVATDDCKIVFYVYQDAGSLVHDFYFLDCDNATCSSGTMSIFEGKAGCTLTGCHSGDTMNNTTSIDCSGGSSDCKVAYREGTLTAVFFADCDNATCTSGTVQLVDGSTSCPLTGCNASDNLPFQSVVLDCSAGVTDCKIAYDNNTKTALYFADCDNATCSTGTVTLLDGSASCVLTGCNSGDNVPNTSGVVNMDCVSATDCKIAYQNGTKSAIFMADCDNATCSSGTATLIDGDTGCTLTNCGSSDLDNTTDIDCTGGATDCKIIYADASHTALKFADCDNATCSSGTITVVDGTTGCGLTGCITAAQISDNESIFCVSATDCKLSYHNDSGSTDALYFGDCDSATCNSGTASRIDGTGWGDHNLGDANAVSCPSSSNCKMAYYDVTDTSLRFKDCDDTTCTTGTTVFLDGTAGCIMTNCLTGDDLGVQITMDCPSSNDCKIVYYNTTKTALYFIDCDSETCNRGTVTLLDGSASCVLTGCNSSDSVGYATAGDPHDNQIFCISGTDCKIAYYNHSKTALYFADCDNATCSSGTAQLVDGFTSCPLIGCNASDQLIYLWSLDMYCVSSTDCKIAYHNDTKSALYMADCDSATCGSGTVQLIDGFTGCTISGCGSGDIAGRNDTIDCIGGSTDCKIVYPNGTTGMFNFLDCDDTSCATGTITGIDGLTGCVLTGCANAHSPDNYLNDMQCISASDCKIVFNDAVFEDLYFADCDDAVCSTGNIKLLDGNSSCLLSGCNTGDDIGNVSGKTIDCLSATDCKISYKNITDNEVYLADCDSATCNSGTAGKVDTIDNEYTWVGLYDTSGTMVSDGIVSVATTSGYLRMRTANSISPSDGNYTVRAFSSDDTDVTSTVKAARLVAAQSNGGGITTTESQVEMGNNETTTGTSYARLTDPKIYYWDSTKFGGVVTVYFEASMKGSGGGITASASLSSDSNCSSTVSGSEVTVTGTTWTRSRSSAITLTDNTEYWVCLKTSSGTASIANAKLIVDQADAQGIQKMELVHQYLNTPQTDGDSTYTSQNYLNQLTKANLVGDVVAYYFEATMKTSGGTGYAQLYNSTDSSAVSGSELTTTSSTYERKRSADLNSVLTTAKTYDAQLKNSASNTTTVSSSRLVIDISTLLIQPRVKGPVRIKGNTRIK